MAGDVLEEEFREFLKAEGVQIMQLFRGWEDEAGDITRRQFNRAMLAHGLGATPMQLELLFTKWDSDDSGTTSARSRRHLGATSARS